MALRDCTSHRGTWLPKLAIARHIRDGEVPFIRWVEHTMTSMLPLTLIGIVVYFFCIPIAFGQSLSTDYLPAVWAGRICSSSTPPDKRVVMLGHDALDCRSGMEICVDRNQPRLEFKAGNLLVISYEWGGAAVRFSCASRESAEAFYESIRGDKVALAVNNQIFGIYSVAGKPTDCGWHQSDDLASAQALCESIAQAWGSSPGNCYTSCGVSNADGSGICISWE